MTKAEDPEEPRTSGLAPRARAATNTPAEPRVRVSSDPAADPLGDTAFTPLPPPPVPRSIPPTQVTHGPSRVAVIAVVAIFVAILGAAIAYALS